MNHHTSKESNIVSMEAERAILGAAIQDFVRVMELFTRYGVTVDHFEDGKNRIVFDALRDFENHGKPVDYITVAMYLNGLTFEAVPLGASGHIDGLVENSQPANAEFYIAELNDRYMRRKGVALLRKYARQFMRMDYDPEMTRGECECAVAVMSHVQKQSEQIKKEAIDEMARMYDAALEKGCAGVRTPFKFWNLNFGGLMPKTLFVVSGNPGCFKTTLVRNVMAYVSGVHGLRTDFLTLEQGRGQIYSSMIAQQAGVNVSTLIAGRSREDRQKWNECRKEVESWPCVIDDTPHTASTLWSWARRAKNKGSVCLAVDYVQYIRGDDARMNEEQRISQAIESCRRISIDLSIPVIAIASQNYQGTLRGSGQIEYAAVNWIKMEKWETEDKSTVLGAQVSIPKSRFSQQYAAFPLYHHRGTMLEEQPVTKKTVDTINEMENEL